MNLRGGGYVHASALNMGGWVGGGGGFLSGFLFLVITHQDYFTI